MSNTKPEWTPAEAMMFEFAIRRELITIRDHPFYGRYKGLLDKDEAIECRDALSFHTLDESHRPPQRQAPMEGIAGNRRNTVRGRCRGVPWGSRM